VSRTKPSNAGKAEIVVRGQDLGIHSIKGLEYCGITCSGGAFTRDARIVRPHAIKLSSASGLHLIYLRIVFQVGI